MNFPLIAPVIMTDHPAWLGGAGGRAVRALRRNDAIWLLESQLTSKGYVVTTTRMSGSSSTPAVDVVNPDRLIGPAELVGPLRRAGSVARWRNPDLWDALATAIIRQVIRAGQARKLYRALSREHGEAVPGMPKALPLFPKPETVLALPDVEYARLGLAFKRNALRAAADAVLEFSGKWTELHPVALRDELQTVPRIGPWTAGAAVADLTNDYALYPFADLAVRTWARRLAPNRAWPDAEPDFGRAWSRLAGTQLSDWTLLTLAWGVQHAHNSGGTAL
ncbi:hypothetical protein [Labedaea rhizosphaerae]|uniref:DNA-3-methyladenine glycosylase II n=1 Tax=Labedaea rhizosphaerae TaxID=598644 RepID=A0A4R6SNU8_LABRH|nr:hypothetical protein [Labedaea rhizosphaerae]TDQ04863.1 DNA-3-methyladenine glycosylase II [Labedaea rhizosphaerae]